MKYTKEVELFGTEIQTVRELFIGGLKLSVHSNDTVKFCFIVLWRRK